MDSFEKYLEELEPEKSESHLRFLELAESIDRKGNKVYLEYLKSTNFFKAPASTSYHLNVEGGLVEHSVNVCELALELNKTLGKPCSDDSIKIASLYHDDGKSEFRHYPYYEDNILKSGKRSEAKPYSRGKKIIPLPHEVISILNVYKYIDLTDDEIWAIIHHNGMYGELKWNLQGKEKPLQMIVHFADMWASRVIEE